MGWDGMEIQPSANDSRRTRTQTPHVKCLIRTRQGTNDLRWQSGWLPFPWQHWSNQLFIPVRSGKNKTKQRNAAGSDRIASDTSHNLINDTCKVFTPSGLKQPKHWMVPGLFINTYTNEEKKEKEKEMRSENSFLIKASVKIGWFIKIWHRVRGGNGCTLPVYTRVNEVFKWGRVRSWEVSTNNLGIRMHFDTLWFCTVNNKTTSPRGGEHFTQAL